MGLLYNEETGEVIPTLERVYISKDEALKMWPEKQIQSFESDEREG